MGQINAVRVIVGACVREEGEFEDDRAAAVLLLLAMALIAPLVGIFNIGFIVVVVMMLMGNVSDPHLSAEGLDSLLEFQ